MKKKILLAIVAILVIGYFFGPNPSTPVYNKDLPNIPSNVSLDEFVRTHEKGFPVKPDNEARIVWADSQHKQPTPYCLVYLHGFSASQKEGDPVHRQLAKKYGCNLYLARLSEHGLIQQEQLKELTADSYWESAKFALAMGKKLGQKVILMGTSTGGTQAIQLAAAFPQLVDALVLLSPNIAINDPNAWLINNPWGLEIARLVKKGNYVNPPDERPIYSAYWNKPYRLEAAVALEEMLETTMNKETFEKVTQPTLLLYYYKNEKEQDPIVKVSAMLDMFEKISTPQALKMKKAIPTAGNHVLASPIKSSAVLEIESVCSQFFADKLRLKAINTE
jgi:pimeloyl-ACP methyl ester carboxylesterase